MSWSIIVIGICLVLLGFSVWKEVVRENKAHLALRILAVVTAAAALACIAIPLSYKSGQTAPDKHEAILLTGGFNPDSLKKYPDQPVFTTSPAIKKEYPKSVLLNTLGELKTDYPKTTGLQVLGYGLADNEVRKLGTTPIIFHPATAPVGISSIGWNHQIKSGEVLKVQGKFNNPDGKNYWIILKGLNVTLDSVAVKASSDFELRTTPKTTGNIVYRLMVKSGHDTLENESLPLRIDRGKLVRVLILSSSPDFENRFLKNWLTANGYAVHIRTAISKDKFSTEAINAIQIPLANITSTILQNFDVVLGDQLALQNLNVGESSALRQQVTQKGLGLIIRADSTGKSNAWFQNSFPVYRTSGQTQNKSPLLLSGQPGNTEALTLDPVNIVFKEGTQVLVSDVKNRAMVSSAIAGSGKQVFSTLNNTYNWMLAGDDRDYTAYWSLLINKAARKSAVSKSFNVLTDIPGVNDETKVEVLSGSVPDSVSLSGVKPAFAQSADVPFLWFAKVWSDKAGWQTVANMNGNTGGFYVFDANDWKTLKNLRKIFVTKAYAKENLLNYTGEQQKVYKINRYILKFWFCLLFLTACTFLWAEAKFVIV
jgi:hypothetical protein